MRPTKVRYLYTIDHPTAPARKIGRLGLHERLRGDAHGGGEYMLFNTDQFHIARPTHKSSR
ncbi:hypothetical protein BSF43_45450 [Pseudomonas ogarae]|nr:hypothetical protein BSF43_45450 [Pseudomonas ogarae]